MGKIVSKTFLSDSMVCNFLNEIKDKGWDMSKCCIWITQGRSDIKTVFYDEGLLKRPSVMTKPSENAPSIFFSWRDAKGTPPGPDKPLICQTDGGKILTFKSRGDERHWEWHVDKYHIKYWAYQEDLLAKKSTGNTQE